MLIEKVKKDMDQFVDLFRLSACDIACLIGEKNFLPTIG